MTYFFVLQIFPPFFTYPTKAAFKLLHIFRRSRCLTGTSFWAFFRWKSMLFFIKLRNFTIFRNQSLHKGILAICIKLYHLCFFFLIKKLNVRQSSTSWFSMNYKLNIIFLLHLFSNGICSQKLQLRRLPGNMLKEMGLTWL